MFNLSEDCAKSKASLMLSTSKKMLYLSIAVPDKALLASLTFFITNFTPGGDASFNDAILKGLLAASSLTTKIQLAPIAFVQAKAI